MLDDYHWEATLSPLGLPTGMCVPGNVERLVSVRPPCMRPLAFVLTCCSQIPPWDPVVDLGEDSSRLEPPTSEEETEVLTAIYNLSNTVIANAASRTLARYDLSYLSFSSLMCSPSG